ncbi:MAG: thiamine pyrophosphate-dependent enzyme [Kouleothrix sp.]
MKLEVWALFGDGALGYSLTEFDTFARHGAPIIAVGNDAGWTQIAREQIDILHDDKLARRSRPQATTQRQPVWARWACRSMIPSLPRKHWLRRARWRRAGSQCWSTRCWAKPDFRKGSISM